MTRRIPIVATILVGLAIAAMIGLGFWQIQRLHQKEALLERLAANEHLPPIAFPAAQAGDALLFRRATAICAQPSGWKAEGGRDAAGETGWRQIVKCHVGAHESAWDVQAGISRAPDATPNWRGGAVSGYITLAPSGRPLIAALFSHRPDPLMVVADPPLAGLEANPPPDFSAVPNNHLAYAVQWFLFALVAGVIYGLALRRRMRSQLVSPPAAR
ncbi:MAG: SURF1 family protein [Pseudomonadota bacterium]|nr:SURF1 family protein [Pseudomonadota bacterium]